ncbi:MAG: STAS domain-containing protein [Pseudonocardiaceae bacterium]
MTVEWQGRATVLAVAGEIDMLTAPRVEEALMLALESRPETLVVDLTDVRFLGSAGLAALIGAQRKAGKQIGFRVVAAGTATSRPLHVTGLDQQFVVYPSREQALNGD